MTSAGPSRPAAPLLVDARQSELERLRQAHRRVQQLGAGAVQRAGGTADAETRALLDRATDLLLSVADVLPRVNAAMDPASREEVEEWLDEVEEAREEMVKGKAKGKGKGEGRK